MMWVLHIIAIIFFIPALFLTIPLHIIISMIKPKEEKETNDKITKSQRNVNEAISKY